MSFKKNKDSSTGRSSSSKHRSSVSKGNNKSKAPAPPKRKVRVTQGSENLIKKLGIEASDMISSRSIIKILENIQLDFPREYVSRIVEYLFLVKEYNEEINLVSRVNINEVLLTSIYESLYLLRDESWKDADSLLDLGSGGGFPGIPLAIANPDIKVTLLDSRRAKILSLQAMVKELDLNNATVIHDRAETFSDHYENKFDRITVRAVGSLKEIIPWVETIINPDGLLLAWKGPEGMREIQNTDKNRWKFVKRISIQPHRYIMFLKNSQAN